MSLWQSGSVACACLGARPTGYTPCEPRGHLVSKIALRCAHHGAICAWLA